MDPRPGKLHFAPLLLLLTVPLFAETADLQLVVIGTPAAVRAGETAIVRIGIRNNGPDIASSYTLAPPEANFPIVSGQCIHGCTQTRLFPGTQQEQWYELQSPPAAVMMTLHASVSSPADPDPSNNSVDVSVPVSTAPDLAIYASTYPRLDAGARGLVSIDYRNYSRTASEETIIDLDFPDGTTFIDLPSPCTAGGSHVTCPVGEVSFQTYHHLSFKIIEPRQPGLEGVVTGTIHGREADFDTTDNRARATTQLYREFIVTHTGDSGDGSLRQSISAANAGCLDLFPCKVRFAIDSPDAWKTIRPLTPLPVLTALDLAIDGGTQTARGDTNAAGPEIEINGSLTAEGDGLVIQTPCSSIISGLTINGFPGNGLVLDITRPCPGGFLRGSSRTVTGNYIGTDPTGSVAVPNGLRGISSTWDEGTGPVVPYGITGNVVSGNLRSGIFLWRGAWPVTRNRIGVAAHMDAPLGNGASGVYIGPLGKNTNLFENVIAYNGEAGIGRAASTSWTNLDGNSIYRNGGLAIDYNMDGVSLEVPNEYGQPMGLPVIHSARYDAGTNKTLIEAVMPQKGRGIFGFYVSFYANDEPDPSGYGEGQRLLGGLRVQDEKPFTFTVDGDLSGQWIAPLATRNQYIGWAIAGPIRPDGYDQGFITESTEFGLAVQVSR